MNKPMLSTRRFKKLLDIFVLKLIFSGDFLGIPVPESEEEAVVFFR